MTSLGLEKNRAIISKPFRRVRSRGSTPVGFLEWAEGSKGFLWFGFGISLLCHGLLFWQGHFKQEAQYAVRKQEAPLSVSIVMKKKPLEKTMIPKKRGQPEQEVQPSVKESIQEKAQVLTEAKPAYLSNPAPHYPASARRMGWEGLVLLTVSVSAEGKALSLDIKESSGRKVLDRAALRAVRGWTFHPATRFGTPVDSQLEVPIRFQFKK